MMFLLRIDREAYLMVIDVRDVSQIAAMKKLNHFMAQCLTKEHTRLNVKGRYVIVT